MITIKYDGLGKSPPSERYVAPTPNPHMHERMHGSYAWNVSGGFLINLNGSSEWFYDAPFFRDFAFFEYYLRGPVVEQWAEDSWASL